MSQINSTDLGLRLNSLWMRTTIMLGSSEKPALKSCSTALNRYRCERVRFSFVNGRHQILVFHVSLLCPERRWYRRSRETPSLPLGASWPLPGTRSVCEERGRLALAEKHLTLRVEIGKSIDSFRLAWKGAVSVLLTMCAVIFSRWSLSSWWRCLILFSCSTELIKNPILSRSCRVNWKRGDTVSRVKGRDQADRRANWNHHLINGRLWFQLLLRQPFQILVKPFNGVLVCHLQFLQFSFQRLQGHPPLDAVITQSSCLEKNGRSKSPFCTPPSARRAPPSSFRSPRRLFSHPHPTRFQPCLRQTLEQVFPVDSIQKKSMCPSIWFTWRIKSGGRFVQSIRDKITRFLLGITRHEKFHSGFLVPLFLSSNKSISIRLWQREVSGEQKKFFSGNQWQIKPRCLFGSRLHKIAVRIF